MSFKWLDSRTAMPGPYLTLVRNEDDFKKAMKHCKVTQHGPWIQNHWADATVHHLEHPDGNRCAVVALRESGRSPIEVAGILVHEAVHISQDYFSHMGESTPATEQQAYAIQAIAQELMAEYARQVKELK